MLRILKKLGIGLAVAAVFLLVVEFALRFALGPEVFYGQLPMFELDERAGFRVAANLNYGGFHTNSLGLRGPAVDSEAKERILILGDSMTLGLEVSDQETFCSVLNERLGAEWQIFNSGCSGYGPIEESAAIDRLAPELKPTRIIIMFFCGNDYLDAGQDGKTYLVIGGRLIARQRYEETSPTSRFFKNIAARFWSTGFVRLARRVGGEKKYEPNLEKKYVGTCGMDNTAVRVLMDKEDYNTIDPIKEPFVSRGWKRMPEHFTKIREQAANLHIPLTVAILPLPVAYDLGLHTRLSLHWKVPPRSFDPMRPTRKMVELLSQLNIPTLDLAPAFKKSPEGELLHLPADLHLSVEGHRLVAEALRDYLLSQRAPANK